MYLVCRYLSGRMEVSTIQFFASPESIRVARDSGLFAPLGAAPSCFEIVDGKPVILSEDFHKKFVWVNSYSFQQLRLLAI